MSSLYELLERALHAISKVKTVDTANYIKRIIFENLILIKKARLLRAQSNVRLCTFVDFELFCRVLSIYQRLNVVSRNKDGVDLDTLSIIKAMLHISVQSIFPYILDWFKDQMHGRFILLHKKRKLVS